MIYTSLFTYEAISEPSNRLTVVQSEPKCHHVNTCIAVINTTERTNQLSVLVW